jgi:hypothetical protein
MPVLSSPDPISVMGEEDAQLVHYLVRLVDIDVSMYTHVAC